MIGLGVILGLSSAACASLSYLSSRQYVVRPGRSLIRLLVLSHVMQGVVCAAILPMLWPAEMPPWRAWAWPVVGCALFYLGGQALLFRALRYVEASRISPLLGMKVVIVAGMAVLLLGQRVPVLGWLAVGMTTAGAMLLNRIGGRIPWPAALAVVGTCLGYALSDVHIQLSIDAMSPPVDRLRAGMLTVCLAYVVCGAVAALGLPRYGSRRPAAWLEVLPYATTWLASMFFLFACFALVAVVYGNILQATRGILSIALGWLIAHLGHEHLEQRLSRGVFWRRLAAATLMFAAIALFGYARLR